MAAGAVRGETAAGAAAPSLTPHVQPLYQTVGYELSDIVALEQAVAGQRAMYARHGAPNEEAAERLLARLEGLEAPKDLGVEAALFSSGMAAIEAAFQVTLAAQRMRTVSTEKLPLVVMASPVYSAARALLCDLANRRQLVLHELEVPDADAVEAVAKHEPVAAIYCEVLTNPRLRVPDLPRLGAIAKAHGATLIVDGTLTTPLLCQPLLHGADLVLHSATKFMGGHGDILAGVVAGRAELVAQVRAYRQLHGAVLDPFAAWLLQRSLKTLAVRLHRQVDTASRLANKLHAQREALGIREVIYPGLAHHPDHARATQLLRRPGAMLAMTMQSPESARRAYERLRLFHRVTSLGDVDSLVMYPAATWSRTLSPKELARFGIAPGLLRLSIGLEDADDLWHDLESTLTEVKGA